MSTCHITNCPHKPIHTVVSSTRQELHCCGDHINRCVSLFSRGNRIVVVLPYLAPRQGEIVSLAGKQTEGER